MSHFYPEIHHARVREVLHRLPKSIILESVKLEAVFACTPEPVPYAQRQTLAYRAIAEGATWGQTWDCGWFHVTGTVPPAWRGAYVTARLDFGGEALVFDAQGVPSVGLTNGSVFDADYHKDTLHLLPSCQGGEAVDLWIDAGANALFGLHRCGDPAWIEDASHLHGRYTGVVNAMRLCRFDYDAWQLWLDLVVLEDLYRYLPETSARRMALLRGMSRALDVLPAQGAAACRAALQPVFAVPSDPATVDVCGVGHAHIDTAWLWPLRETVRKCARTFASQLGLIARYPGYVFGASQAQLYAFTKQHYPELYARIQQAVAAGRWEIQGGMWVEADCNLIGGESLVRQFVHGKNFFRDEFGVEVRNLWLPDVFGYSANLPQILQQAGTPYFLTQKMSWNRYNRMPHNTFIWRGIDGSEVLAHFPPEDNYNSAVVPSQIRKNETNNQERGLVQDALCLFGIGDGGGGPKEEYIERALRLRDLNGCPRFRFGPAQPVLERMAACAAELDTWSGELYFELHRGTLTTQAAVKRWNRRAEEALRATEMLCAAAGVQTYPAAALDRLWKDVLLNQFHDIIPGSSIHRVYVETEAMLRAAVTEARALERAAAERLLKADPQAAAVFNPSSTPFTGAVALPAGWSAATDAAGQPLPVQRETDAAVSWVTVPPQQFVTLRRTAGESPATPAVTPDEGPWVLENDEIRYTFDAQLQLVAAFDKQAQVACIPAGEPGNRIELFDDHPHAHDAWDIEEYYSRMRVDTARAVSLRRIGTPTVRSGLEAELRVGESTLRQRVWLGRTGKRLDFVTETDWQERHRLLRVAFPVTVAADEAAFEIQYGHVRRPTHDNTKWDYAQFECVGHRWADLSRRDYGVALLNDSKYGYRVKGHTLELSLLRAPTEPDPVADQGSHLFTYSLLPHTGDLVDSDVRAQAAIINQGLDVFAGLAAAPTLSLPVRLQGDGIELAVLKRAERSDDLIVRVVELRGIQARGALVCADTGATLTPTDLLEWRDQPTASRGRFELDLKPFEIRTFRLTAPAAPAARKHT